MKMTKKILQTWLSVLILIQTSLLQIALPELVICFGEDGHVAIERDDRPDCGHPLNATEEVALTGKYDDQHHFGCTDLSLDLLNGTPLTKTKQNHSDAQATIHFYTVLNFDALQKYDLTGFTQPVSFEHPILNSIRATTLLI
ncbi:MAG: hypothetical protein AB7W47_15925 [Calditrichaceae bacterium]